MKIRGLEPHVIVIYSNTHEHFRIQLPLQWLWHHGKGFNTSIWPGNAAGLTIIAMADFIVCIK